MQTFNSFQEIREEVPTHVATASCNEGKSVLDKYAPYMDVPEIRERVERMQELKKQWNAARDVIRELGGDAESDNPFLNEP